MDKFKKVFIVLFFFGIFFGAPKVLAATIISGNFKLTSDDPLFSAVNALPGGKYTSDFTVENIGTNTENLQMKLDIKTDPVTLADFLFLEIKNKDTNECLLGCASSLTVNNANGTELTFKNIGPGETKNYTFILLFDANAGNQFQNSTMTFDLTLGYQGSAPAIATLTNRRRGGGGGNGGGGAGAGGALAAPVLTGGTPPGVNAPPVVTESSPEKPPLFDIVAEPVQLTQCRGWPLWVWILALVIFTLNFWRNARQNYRLEEYGWKVALAWTVTGAAFWYYFDFCRQYRWFLYGAIIIAIVSHFVYLYYLRKKVNKQISR